MRILHYKSAAVKLRIDDWAPKVADFRVQAAADAASANSDGTLSQPGQWFRRNG
jgi:hypothetical protein